jgi:hypothetical protein
LEDAFDKRRATMAKGHRNNVILAFHGTSEEAIETIAKENFDIARLAANTGAGPQPL